MLKTMASIISHFKCLGGFYPRSSVQRFPVKIEQLDWASPYDNYQPPNYTSPTVAGKPWADPDISDPNFNPEWNILDGIVNRESYTGTYVIQNRYPLNPVGRTGLRGRGLLGRWGPNHAADSIVTRWKKSLDGDLEKDNATNKPILQFVCIQRRDTREWALPGGMVDPGEKVAAAALREFQEEATNSLSKSGGAKSTWNEKLKSFFEAGDVVYQGYVDDPRNTDNAWMETVAYSFHDEEGSAVGAMRLNAGDDAVGVRWLDVSSRLQLYASHRDIVQAVALQRNAHW